MSTNLIEPDVSRSVPVPRMVAAFCLGLLCLTGARQALPETPPAEHVGGAAIEEVVVVGRRPGPPLWRVDNGDNTLWLFGTLEPLPRSLQWDAESVEWIVSESQAYITPPYISASTSNPFKAFGAYRKLKALEKLPERKTLREVLPDEVFDSFEHARARFDPGNNRIYRLRPMVAAEKLFTRAHRSVGLTGDTGIERTLKQIARKHKVPIVRTDSEIEINEALGVFRAIELAVEIDCLATTLHSIDSDLKGALQRALAWADGDASLLQSFDYPDVDLRCSRDTFASSDARRVRQTARERWLATVTDALDSNRSTFASLPVRELIHPEGLLAELRSRGYAVRGQ